MGEWCCLRPCLKLKGESVPMQAEYFMFHFIFVPALLLGVGIEERLSTYL
jgi:hypothetical protein